jgi:ABC-type branched-subunit amino acid transport system ATPase component
VTAAEVLQRFDQRRLARDAARLAVENAEAESRRQAGLLQTAEAVRVFFTVLSDAQRKELEQRVESLVDYGVQVVFGPTYRFKVTSEMRGKAVRTEFWLVENGLQLPLLEATGGGVGDVVSFLLRVVILCLARPSQRRVLVLDEPFKFVSASHFQTLAGLLRELSDSLGLQLIMVTHKPELLDAAMTIVRVHKTEAGSVAQIEREG